MLKQKNLIKWVAFIVCAAALTASVAAQEDDRFDYITDPDNAETIGYACYTIGAEADGVFFNAEERFPLASTFKIIVLVEYARQVAAGQLDPAERVPIAVLDAYYLPNTDGGAYDYWLAEMATIEDDTVSLESVVRGMIEVSVNASTDYLIERLNITDGVDWYDEIGITDTDQPRIILGDFLALVNHETGVFDVQNTTDEEQAELSAYLLNQYLDDADWRRAERGRSGFIPIVTQQAYFQRFGNFGTPADFARLMAAIYDDAFGVEASDIMRDVLGWPARAFPESWAAFEAIGTKGGSLPGTLTAAYYADGVDSAPMVLAVFYRQLDPRQYIEWLGSFEHQLFEIDVLNTGCDLLP